MVRINKERKVNQMEEKKNELGRIYGSRLSKNGKWLNVIVAVNIKGEDVKLTIPVSLEQRDGKPHAELGTMGYAVLYGIRVFEEAVKQQTDTMEAPLFREAEELPF